MSTIVLTSIYHEFWGTEEFRRSVQRVGLPLHNCWKGGNFTGNGDAIRNIYEGLIELKDKYEYAIYADGADSLFLRPFQPPDYILYSTEKAIWPPIKELEQKWHKLYDPNEYHGLIYVSPWRFLNGGGYCGPIELLIKYFEKYGLDKLKGDINGQKEQAEAFLKAFEDEFPIHLDYRCEYFQTTGHAAEEDFGQDGTGFYNFITGTHPYLLHGNGRTDMSVYYENYRNL